MEAYMDPLIAFLTGKFPYAMEGTILGHAFFGALVIKEGKNKNGELHWFHAFVLSTVAGFAGGLFNPMWMGKPTPMISNDVVFASSVFAFSVVNFVPLDLGHKLTTFFPVKLVITVFAILFRSLGLVNFITMAFTTYEDFPSKYYPIPVFGPIFYGIMLGNMGGLFTLGIDGYLGRGIPWAFQNGMFCAPLFHFYVHDTKGPVGELLRSIMAPVQALLPGVDERTFATACVSLFMQVVGILQLPIFLGGSFSPFVTIHNLINAPLNAVLSKGDNKSMSVVGRKEKQTTERTPMGNLNGMSETTTGDNGKRKKSKGRKNKQKSS